MEVHRELGCGFNEVFFQDALEVEFQLRGIPYAREQAYHVFYKGRRLPSSLRPDFVCFGEVIVELKALTEITGREEAQILGYLKGTGFQTGLLLISAPPACFKNASLTPPNGSLKPHRPRMTPNKTIHRLHRFKQDFQTHPSPLPWIICVNRPNQRAIL